MLQYGARVAVIELSAASPHLSIEGEGCVAVKVAMPPFILPLTCHVMLPQFPLGIVSEPVMSDPVWLRVQVPPFSGSAHFPLTSPQFTGTEVQ